jgi:hypothetical protein
MIQTRSIGREIGTALAVLAIYLLTLLTPLHHARASQLAFEQAGYTTITASWVTCTAGSLGDTDRSEPVAKCPVTGVAKSDLIAPVPGVAPAGFALLARVSGLPPQAPVIIAAASAPPGGPRAPPPGV